MIHHKKHKLLAIAGVLLFFISIWQHVGAVNISELKPQSTLYIDFKETDIRDALQAIAVQHSANIIVDPDVNGRVTVWLSNAPFEEPVINTSAETQSSQSSNYKLSSGVTTLNLDEEQNILAEFQNARLQDLLTDIAAVGGPKFQVDRDWQNDRVSGRISGQPAADAIRTFMQASGYSVWKMPDSYLIRSNQSTKPFIYMDNQGLFYLEVYNTDLTQVIREIAGKADKPIIIYYYARSTINYLSLHGVTLEQALTTILRGTNYTFIERDGVLLIGDGVTPLQDSPELTETKFVRLRYLQPNDFITLLPASLPAQNIEIVPGQNALIISGSVATIARIEEFINSVDVPIPEMHPVIVPIHYVKADSLTPAMARVFPTLCFQYLQTENAFVLSGNPELIERMKNFIAAIDIPEVALQTDIITVKHIKAEEVRELLPLQFETTSVLVIAEQNALTITGRAENVQKIKDDLAAIDIRNPQIIFEIVVTQINDRQSNQFGLAGNTADGIISFDLLAPSPVSVVLGVDPAGSTLIATLSTLIQEGKARVLANPTLSTLNGKEALFNVVTTNRYWDPRIVIDDKKEGENDAGKQSTVVPAFKTEETGIKIRLKPWVSTSGEITVEVQPEISDSAGISSGLGLPQTNDRSVQTTVRVKDGETIFIGGLLQQREYIDIAKIPILGDLPIIGPIFRRQNKSTTESEFVITIKCRLVYE